MARACACSKRIIAVLAESAEDHGRSTQGEGFFMGPVAGFFVPNPVNCRFGDRAGEVVAHSTPTTANSRRIGVVALFSGTSANVPPTGHSPIGLRHGGKHPST
jgi:hypothetical protein